MLFPSAELWSFGGVLLALLLIYILIETHYIFAFKLMSKTEVYEGKKEKVQKIQKYFFKFLHWLYPLSFIIISILIFLYLKAGNSLELLIINSWQSIPEGFWLHALLVLVRIVLLIIVMRYILKRIYRFLDKEKVKTLAKNRYTIENVKLFYLRLHNSIKFSIVLGVMYRIVHFFPFLEEVSYVFLFALIAFISIASVITLKEFLKMKIGE